LPEDRRSIVGAGIADSADAKHPYETPAVIPLGELARGTRLTKCDAGTAATTCEVGHTASSNCENGGIADKECGDGTAPGTGCSERSTFTD
jgi:hypothetical protein